MSGGTVETLTNQSVYDGDGVAKAPDANEFGLQNIKDDDSSFGVLNSMNDRYNVLINTSAVETGNNAAGAGQGLSTGESLQLQITSRTGGTTTVKLNMPQQLAGKNPGEPVEL